MGKKKIYLVEWRYIPRFFLTRMIQETPDLELAGWTDKPDIATASILARQPDLVMTDVFFHDLAGIRLAARLRREAPRLPVLLYSLVDDPLCILMAMEAGAKGFSNATRETPEALVQGMRRLMKGETYLGGGAAECVAQVVARSGSVRKATPATILSGREMKVFHLLGQGMSTREIARNMGIHIKTVLTHRAATQRKLGLKDSAKLVHFSVR